MLVVLLAGWSGARAMLWENPYAALPAPVLLAGDRLPGERAGSFRQPSLVPPSSPAPPAAMAEPLALSPGAGAAAMPSRVLPFAAVGLPARSRSKPQLAAAHELLRGDPDMVLPANPGWAVWGAAAPVLPLTGTRRAQPDAAAPPAATNGRWFLDAWTFWRQGSDAAPISQGRVPIYGASQSGAVLQFRLAPGSRHDPRLYARAYRALVPLGEQEAALGASLRPLARLPLRLAAEARYTDGPFSSNLRPAAYAVSELAPIALPLSTRLEAYAQAGWVGGPGATAFADGQASVTRDIRQLTELTGNAVRFSFGAAAWGGAQKGAERVDIGPTLRFDMTVGKVPARLSVDWRQQVAGDAAPDSGLAATLSTQF